MVAGQPTQAWEIPGDLGGGEPEVDRVWEGITL